MYLLCELQGINFGTFTLHMSIGAVLVACFAYGLLRFMYRKRELLVSEDSLEIRGNLVVVLSII